MARAVDAPKRSAVSATAPPEFPEGSPTATKVPPSGAEPPTEASASTDTGGACGTPATRKIPSLRGPPAKAA